MVISCGDVDFETTQLKIRRTWRHTERYFRWAHLDLSLTRDSAGIAVGHCPEFVEIQRSETVFEVLPVIRFDLILEVRPPPNGEVQYEKIRELLYRLRESGLPIQYVTADRYMSADMLQMLGMRGFQVGVQSMDRTTEPYELARAAFYDGRVDAPHHSKALKELAELEYDPKRRKIDHPPTAGASKDLADAMAGVI